MMIESNKIIEYLDSEIDTAFQKANDAEDYHSSKSMYDRGALEAFKKVKMYITNMEETC